jgi:hypothetical protein
LKIGRDVSCAGGEEETKRRKGRRGREEGGRERERESKGRQKRVASISHFLRKKNYALSPLLTDERGGRGIKKKKKMWHIYIFFFFVNWSYFTMGLLYWGLILEALSFYRKKTLGLI